MLYDRELLEWLYHSDPEVSRCEKHDIPFESRRANAHYTGRMLANGEESILGDSLSVRVTKLRNVTVTSCKHIDHLCVAYSSSY